MYAGLQYQSVFSKIGSMSPAFIVNPEIYVWADSIKQQDPNFRVYFVCGDREQDPLPTVQSDMVLMHDNLRMRGYSHVKYTVIKGARHGEGFWKLEFPEAYRWLFGLSNFSISKYLFPNFLVLLTITPLVICNVMLK